MNKSKRICPIFRIGKKRYNDSMDDRKKLIGELEQRKREQIGILDSLLPRLGEVILDRVTDDFPENEAVFGELTVYRRLCNDIIDSGTSIQAVEEQIRRFKELEENIEVKELEEGNSTKELANSYGKLGKLLLDLSEKSTADNAAYADFCAPYRDHAKDLFTKVLSLEDRLSGLGQKEGGNVFTWIGKNAQSLVLRSFLTRAQDNLEQLRRNVGERYSRNNFRALPSGEMDNERAVSESTEIENLCAGIEQQKAELHNFSRELAVLKDERTAISVSYNSEGGPLRRIQILKSHITHVRDEQKGLYKRVGADAASVHDLAEISAERRHIIDSLVMPEDRVTLDNIAQISRQIGEDEIAIEKLRISLAIDEEKAKIEKYRKMILDKKDKIAQAERNINEYERYIRDSEAAIQKLQDKEQYGS
jgi:uncharacterized coiled-coil DUF342 family protein